MPVREIAAGFHVQGPPLALQPLRYVVVSVRVSTPRRQHRNTPHRALL